MMLAGETAGGNIGTRRRFITVLMLGGGWVGGGGVITADVCWEYGPDECGRENNEREENSATRLVAFPFIVIQNKSNFSKLAAWRCFSNEMHEAF